MLGRLVAAGLLRRAAAAAQAAAAAVAQAGGASTRGFAAEPATTEAEDGARAPAPPFSGRGGWPR